MKRVGILIGLYLAVGLQISIAAPIRSLPWDVDLVLLALVFIAGFSSRGEAVFWAMVAGLLLDVFDPASMGGHIIAKSSAVFLFCILNGSLNLYRPSLLAITFLLLSLVDRLVFRLFTPFIGNYGWALLRFDLPSAIATALVGFIFLWIAMGIGIFTPGTSPERDRPH